MFISGLLIILSIPIVWLKPTINLSESLNPKSNDTLRSKRQPEFYDFIHNLIEKHANNADQHLAPLKPFGNFKQYETFIYPHGFPKPKQQFRGVPHTSSHPQVKMCPLQHRAHTVSYHDPDILKYIASSKASKPIVVGQENPRIPSFITRTYNNLPIHVNGYTLRNSHKQQVEARNRKIFNEGLKDQNFIKPMITTSLTTTTTTKPPIIKSSEKPEISMDNILTSSGPVNITTPQNCTCPKLLASNNKSSSSLNFEQNLNTLVQELEGMANFNNHTKEIYMNSTAFKNKDILRMLEKFKTLQKSMTNRTTTANIETATVVNTIDNLLRNSSSSEPEILFNNNTDSRTSSILSFKGTNLQKENFESTSTSGIETNTTDSQTSSTSSFVETNLQKETNTTESLGILNSDDIKDNVDETAVKDSSIDLNIDDEVGLGGAPALTLDSKDLVKITAEIQNEVNDLNNKTLLKEPQQNLTNLEKINDFETFAMINLLTNGETLSENNEIFNNETPKQFRQNTTLSNEVFIKKSENSIFQNSDKSSSQNISVTNNGRFKTININQKSPETSNNNEEITMRKSANKDFPNTKIHPNDMTGTSSRYVKYFRNLKKNASSRLSDGIYAEPIVSEIYPVKKNKSPLSIYLHRIEKHSKDSNNKHANRDWRIIKSGEDDDISTLSKECEDYEDSSESEELQQRYRNHIPKFSELFNYDTNLT